ncbi:MAG TPA: class I SAM-dependent methyltransferase [Candidatus Eisenbacteria bacterium]|nr:class I SAM-dependent methyltransferase [Candidatus Eisenbacteria bacterium]
MSRARSAAQFFDDYARDFDAIYGKDRGAIGRWLDGILRKSMRLRFERTLEGCRPVAGKTVLDIGCGPGHYGVALAREGAARVVLLDPAKEMLGMARARAEQAGVLGRSEFVHSSFEAFQTSDSFDFCILTGLMDYIPDARGCVRHVIEVTRQSAFFSFPAAGGVLAAQRRWRYRNRTKLFLYREDQVRDLFANEPGVRFTLERIARDYFVRLDAIPAVRNGATSSQEASITPGEARSSRRC